MIGTVVVTGGGTGGHLKVADAFIEELHNRGISVIFIGSSNGQDKAWFENDKRLRKAIFLDTRGVVNKNAFGKVKSLFNIFSKTLTCLDIFSKHNVRNVISVGGFSAAAATFAAITKIGCKLYIHEQNSKMGRLNEITSKFATELFSSYDETSLVQDYPVAYEFFDNARVREKIETVAFFGGSQGAVAINNFALKVAPKLKEMNINIIHQTGKNDFSRVQKEYEKLNIEADVFDFTKDIPQKMFKADFAVSRAGASTLWEMSANALPALFVPYKYAAGNHQFYNAKSLVVKDMAFVCDEDVLNEEVFFKAIDSDINSMSKKLVKAISPNAVSLIVNIILEKAKK